MSEEVLDEVWKVPARTIDMLGRQQIANIPTALHELFKNAHDAFADEVVADYFREDEALVVRDDGDGMTMDQLRAGWLTLASSSKGGTSKSLYRRGDGKAPRAIMGEKGIGRLAIAAIGRQVLIMTRSRPVDGEPAPLLASLVHWNVNRLPDVDLSRIVVPTVRIHGGGVPDAAAVRRLADRLATNVRSLRTDRNGESIDEILEDLAKLDLDPGGIMASLSGPTLQNGCSGTHFVITPVDAMLSSDLTRPSPDEASQVEKYLLGFSNTMMPDRPPPSIVASFNDRFSNGEIKEPIKPESFFTPGDFLDADHSIEGAFDRTGQFSGTIRVYGGEPREHRIVWRGRPGDTQCGAFRINFAYIQGRLSETRLDAETHARVSSKLGLMGGLYVYRNGIRILPYGGPDQDFVGIEGRRNKSVSDWFFSYRRMFGAIEISHEENSNLKEKAGREGFIRDLAYKDFVSILSNFFESLAVDFFRESSTLGEWFETRKRLTEQKALLARRARSGKQKVAQFGKDLDRVLSKLDSAQLATAATSISSDLEIQLSTVASRSDPEQAGHDVFEAERAISRRIDGLENELVLPKLRGAALPKSRAQDWDFYTASLADARDKVLTPLRAAVRKRVDEFVGERGLDLDRRTRISAALDERSERTKSSTRKLGTKVSDNLEALRDRVDRLVRSSAGDIKKLIDDTRIDFERTDTAKIADAEIDLLRARWERALETGGTEVAGRLEAVADQLKTLLDALGRGETLDQVTDAIEARSTELREQLDQYAELAQLGTAVGIVQHEFASAVIRVRAAIRRLDPWARANPALADLNRDLRDGFEHLDAYLGLFAPLSRRLTATRVGVSGGEVERYVDEVFRDRLARHGIETKATDAFRAFKLQGQPSAILAAFVNLVDNAIHWTSTASEGKRTITFGVDGDGMTVSNSGPGIEPRIAERIFEYGETSRLGGRGLGLYVSREALKRSDLALSLVATGRDTSPIFRIGPIKSGEGKEI
ncbi:MAG: ATP-binding protein [Methylobacterium radiotolerans]